MEKERGWGMRVNWRILAKTIKFFVKWSFCFFLTSWKVLACLDCQNFSEIVVNQQNWSKFIPQPPHFFWPSHPPKIRIPFKQQTKKEEKKFDRPQIKHFLAPQKRNWTEKQNKKEIAAPPPERKLLKKFGPPLKISLPKREEEKNWTKKSHGIDDTSCIALEIQRLPCAEIFCDVLVPPEL